MKDFSINRFGRTLRWVFSANLRTLLTWTAGAALAAFLGEMFLASTLSYVDAYTMGHQYASWGMVILAIASLFLFSSITLSINDKRKRCVFLMLPATNMEKYLALMVYAGMVCVVFALLAFAAGDTLRMAWFWIAGAPEGSSTASSYDPTYSWHSSALPLMLKSTQQEFASHGIADHTFYAKAFKFLEHFTLYAILLWTHSLFTLGGTLLRKHPAVLTAAIYIFCLLACAYTMDKLNIDMFMVTWSKESGYEAGSIGAGYVFCIGLPLLAAFNYWASYRIFKGFQLITNKWTNYDILKR